MSFRRRMMMAVNSKPYDAEIEYLESDGNQIIRDYDLILIGYDNTIETKISFLGYLSGTSDNIILGAYTNSTSNAYMLSRRGTINTQINVVWGRNAGNGATTANIVLGTITDIKLYPTYGTINGSNITYKTSTGNQNTSFFRIINKNVLQRLYSMKITKSNNVVLDIIPVRVGQVGYMYDKVSGKLFGNLGTGNFILGNDIN